MPIQKCKSCQRRFEKSQIFTSMFSGFTYKPITCKECETVYVPTVGSRFVFGLIQAFPIFIMNWLLKLMGGYFLFLYIAWMIIIIALAPYILRYEIKE